MIYFIVLYYVLPATYAIIQIKPRSLFSKNSSDILRAKTIHDDNCQHKYKIFANNDIMKLAGAGSAQPGKPEAFTKILMRYNDLLRGDVLGDHVMLVQIVTLAFP